MKHIRWLLCLVLLLLLSSCTSSPQRYVENGNKYFAKKKYKEASIMYRRALQKEPKYYEAWYRLGLTNLQLGQGQEAVRDLLRATEEQVDKAGNKFRNMDAVLTLGNVYLSAWLSDSKKYAHFLLPERGELKEQVVDLLNKDSFDFKLFTAYINFANGKWKDSINFFEKANEKKQDQPQVLLGWAQALMQDGQLDLAEKHCREMIAKHKTVPQTYDLLYVFYQRTNRPELMEQILKEKVANIPGQGQYVAQLAAYYYGTNRKSDGDATLTRLTSDLKTYPNAHRLAGDLYVAMRDFDDAMKQYQQGEKDDPTNKSGYQKRMAEILTAQGKDDQARKIVADLLKDNSKDPEAIAMHAALSLKTNDRTKAKAIIAELQPLVAKTPGNPTLHYNLGKAYMLSDKPGDAEQARLQFEETIKETEENKQLVGLNVAAKVYRAEFELARGESAKAVQTCKEILAVDGRNLRAALLLSNGYMNLKDNENARKWLTLILQGYPNLPDAHFQMGQLNLRQERFKEAEEEFNVLKKSNDPRGLVGLVDVKVAEKDYESALSLLRDQLRQTPDRAEYQFALANIEFGTRKWADAANDYQKLIDRDPKQLRYYIRLGETKRNAGDLNSAVAIFKKAHEIAPNDATPVLSLAMLYDTTGRPEEARKAYEDVLKLQPDNPVALNNLAYAKADAGDPKEWDEALTYAQRARQKLPDNPDVRDTLSLIYIRKNMNEDSIRLLKELTSQTPERATYHLHLAMAYFQQGDKKGAKRELDTAARNKPTEKEQVKIKEYLAKVG